MLCPVQVLQEAQVKMYVLVIVRVHGQLGLFCSLQLLLENTKDPTLLLLPCSFTRLEFASAGGENIKEKIKNPKIEPIHGLMSVCLSLHPRTVGQGR